MRQNVFDAGGAKFLLATSSSCGHRTPDQLNNHCIVTNWIFFGVKSDRFLSQLRENISGLDTNAITLDRALSYYVQGCEGTQLAVNDEYRMDDFMLPARWILECKRA